MFGIGFFEVLVILVIALLVFGPDRVPTMIKEAAAFIRDLRAMVAKARNDFGDSVSDLGIDKEDLELLRELRNPKSYLRQQVLNGADLGLDDLGLNDPELSEATSLNGGSNGKPKSARPASHGSGSAEPGSSKPHEITEDDSGTTTAAHNEAGSESASGAESSDTAAADDAGSRETNAREIDAQDENTVATQAAAPRFDPDTT